MQKVILNLTAPEHHESSKFPGALRHLLYSNDALLELVEWNGCPNSGCEHNLTVQGNRDDIIGWLDLFVGTYPATMPEILMVKREMRSQQLNSEVDTIRVTLKKIKKVVTIKGEIADRPWFWTPSWEEE